MEVREVGIKEVISKLSLEVRDRLGGGKSSGESRNTGLIRTSGGLLVAT